MKRLTTALNFSPFHYQPLIDSPSTGNTRHIHGSQNLAMLLLLPLAWVRKHVNHSIKEDCHIGNHSFLIYNAKLITHFIVNNKSTMCSGFAIMKWLSKGEEEDENVFVYFGGIFVISSFVLRKLISTFSNTLFSNRETILDSFWTLKKKK